MFLSQPGYLNPAWWEAAGQPASLEGGSTPADAVLKVAQRGVQCLLLPKPHTHRRRAPAAGRQAAAAGTEEAGCGAVQWRGMCARQTSPAFSGSGSRRAQSSGTSQAVSKCAALIAPIEQGKVLVNGCGVPSQRRAAAVNQLLRWGGQGAVRRVSGCAGCRGAVRRCSDVRSSRSKEGVPHWSPVPSHLVAGALVVLADRQLHVLPCLVAEDGLQQEAVGACARGTVVREVRSTSQVSHTKWTSEGSSGRLRKQNSGVEGGRCSHEYTELHEPSCEMGVHDQPFSAVP